jgi:hypothetical protein
MAIPAIPAPTTIVFGADIVEKCKQLRFLTAILASLNATPCTGSTSHFMK